MMNDRQRDYILSQLQKVRTITEIPQVIDRIEEEFEKVLPETYPIENIEAHVPSVTTPPILLVIARSDGVELKTVTPEQIYSIGRRMASDIRLPHSAVSRTHGELRVHANGTMEVRDVKSRNGIFIGGQRIPPHTSNFIPVPTGEVVTIVDTDLLSLQRPEL